MLPEKEVIPKKKEKHYQININKFKWLALRNTALYICCICGAIMKSHWGPHPALGAYFGDLWIRV